MLALVDDDTPPDGPGGPVAVLERRLADLLGKEDALFFPSGTMAQQTALREHHVEPTTFRPAPSNGPATVAKQSDHSPPQRCRLDLTCAYAALMRDCAGSRRDHECLKLLASRSRVDRSQRRRRRASDHRLGMVRRSDS
ncbi:hypothetical protein [Nonomuraea turkmeniaca]